MSSTRLAWMMIAVSMSIPLPGASQSTSPLERAAFEGNLARTRSLLSEGQSQSTRDSALELAISAGHLEIIDLLIEGGALWALETAAEAGQMRVVQHLLDGGPDANDLDWALRAAVRAGHLKVAERLIENGADVNASTWRGLPPLCIAASLGADPNTLHRFTFDPLDLQQNWREQRDSQPERRQLYRDMIRLLIEHGADVKSEIEESSFSPLHYAIFGGDKEIVELLLKRGARVNLRTGTDEPTYDQIAPLHLAVHFGELAMAELLLAHDADVNAVTGEDFMRSWQPNVNQTPLHLAAWMGHLELALLLIRHNADIHAVDSQGETALHFAASNKTESLVGILLDKGAKADVVSEDGQTPLHYAAIGGNRHTIELLLSHGADVDRKNQEGLHPASVAARNGWDDIAQRLASRQTDMTLHTVASLGDLETMAAFLDSGVHVDRIDIREETPLHAAMRTGQVNAVRWLLEQGADPNYSDERGYTPLSIAVSIAQDISASYENHETPRSMALKRRWENIMTQLISRAAVPSLWLGIPRKTVLAESHRISILLGEVILDFMPRLDGKGTLLHRAAWWGQKDGVVELLELGADIHARDHRGGTPLHAATQRGSTSYWDVVSGPHEDTLKTLLNKGASVNARNDANATPLHGAAGFGDVNAVTLLLEFGAEVNAADEDGRTPLHEAAQRGSTDVMELLVENGADLNLADSTGNTPLLTLLASLRVPDESDKARLRKFVLNISEKGDASDSQSREGHAPLLLAAALGFPDLVEELLRRGAPFDGATPSGWTALHSAVSRNHANCVEVLIKYGADLNRPGQAPKKRYQVGQAKVQSPLQLAVSRERDEILKLLIAAGVDVNVGARSGEAPLKTAFDKNRFDVFKRLLERGADPNTVGGGEIPAVYLAAARGRRKMLEALLEVRPRGDSELLKKLLETGSTPLHEAVKGGDIATVKTLLAQGIEINIPDRRYLTPLQYAWRQRDLELVMLLLPGSPVAVLNRLLRREIEKGTEEMITMLLSYGADANTPDPISGGSILHRLVSLPIANPKAIEILIAHGADVNAIGKNCGTPLAVAARRHQHENLSALLSHGADHRIAWTYGGAGDPRTPLQIALMHRFYSGAEILVRAGSDVNVNPNSRSGTPLFMAVGHQGLFELMLDHGGEIDSASKKGLTPLHRAAEEGLTDFLEYLINKGAALNIQDDKGDTPLHLAAKKGQREVYELLLTNRVDSTIRNNKGRLAVEYAVAAGIEDESMLVN